MFEGAGTCHLPKQSGAYRADGNLGGRPLVRTVILYAFRPLPSVFSITHIVPQVLPPSRQQRTPMVRHPLA